MPNEVHIDLRVRALSYLTGLTYFAGIDSAPSQDLTISKAVHALTGSATDQVDQVYARRRSLASGATELLDLNGSSLKDVFGNNLSFAELCLVLIINEDADGTPNTTNLTVGAGTNQITNILGSAGATKILRPGDIFLTANFGASGIAAITAGTGDELQIVNAAGATCNYQIILAGRSVA